MRRLVCLLAVCALSGCTSTGSDIGQEIIKNPPATAGLGKVAIWASSAAPLLPKWPRVKTWSASVTRCNQGPTGPEVGAITDDGLPVIIEVLEPSGQEPRLAAVVQYASDGSPPRRDAHDEQLLIVSDRRFSPAEANDYRKGSFEGGFVHAPVNEVNEPPSADGSGTVANVSWHCPDG